MHKLLKTISLTILSLLSIGFLFVPMKSEARTLNTYSAHPILSVLGDSISSYFGFVPNPYYYYAPSSTEGFVSYYINEDDMWWAKLCDKSSWDFGWTGSVGGGQVTRPVDDVYSMFYQERIDALDNNGNPDYVIIYGGTNDILNNANPSYFVDRYLDLTDLLHSIYNQAKFILVGPGYFVKGDHPSYVSVDYYNTYISAAAADNHDYYADLRGAADHGDFADGAELSIHPNESGHARIADRIYEELSSQRGECGIDSIRADLDYDHYVVKVNAYSPDYDTLRFKVKITESTSKTPIYNTDWTYDNCYELYDIDPDATYTVTVDIDADSDGKSDASDEHTFTGLEEKRTGTTVYQGKDYSHVYDFNYYMEHYEDLYNVFKNDPEGAIRHFVECGMNEGRQASEEFNIICYASGYPDLFNAFLFYIKSYYIHYIDYGVAEGRIATLGNDAIP